ncbi:G-protein coupled receptor 54-like isoform X2 [Macrobrachium nipponense]
MDTYKNRSSIYSSWLESLRSPDTEFSENVAMDYATDEWPQGRFAYDVNGSSYRNGSRYRNGSFDNSSSEYDYDYDMALETFFWSQLVPPLVVYSVTYVVGVVGNVLIIFTIARYRRLKTTTNVFLASLASADLLLILICIPVKIARLFSYTWTMGYFLCKLIYYMQTVSSVCSVLTLTIMSLERCYAIIYPMKAIYVCTISKARKATLVIWIASFILASPNLLIRIHMEVGVRVRAYWCVNNFDAPLTWRAYETYMMILVLILPVCVMAVAYTSIGIAIVKVVGQRRTITGKGQMETAETTANGQGGPGTGSLPTEDKTVRQVVPMLIVVVVLFLICWGPILVLNILQAFDVVPLYDVWAMHAKTALDLLSYVNSSTNPIVYGFMSRNFRKGFRRALCSVVRQDEGHHSLSQSHTLRPVTGANRVLKNTSNGTTNTTRVR